MGRLLACPVLKIPCSLVLGTTQNEHPKKADTIGGGRGANDYGVFLDMARIHLPYNPWLSKQRKRNRLEDHAGSGTPYLHTCSHLPPLEIAFTATVRQYKEANNNDGVARMYGTKHMARTCPSPLLCPSPFISTSLRILKVGGSQRNYITKELRNLSKVHTPESQWQYWS